MPHHVTILQVAFTQMIDVICVQEPYTSPSTKTQNHPSYDCYAPTDSWDGIEPDQREAERPRVMTYVRKGAGLKTQQRRSIQSRDLLWIDVNGYAILNVYRQPHSIVVMDYVTHLAPPPQCLVGGDFNAWHDMWEPGIQPANRGADLARWSADAAMDYIGTVGEPTQRSGHVLDLTFSNISFAYSEIRQDMHSGSDHETQVTTIPGRGRVPLEQVHHRVPEAELGKFAGLVGNSIARLADPWDFTSTTQIDDFAEALGEAFTLAIQIVGKPDRGGGTPAPWWTPECQAAYDEHLQSRSYPYDNTPRPLGNSRALSVGLSGSTGSISLMELVMTSHSTG
jgi:hypothetical protein